MKLFFVLSTTMVCWAIILVKADNWEEHQVKIFDRKKLINITMKCLFCSLNTQPKPELELMNFKSVEITLTKLIAEFRDTTKGPTPHSKWDIINSPPWYTVHSILRICLQSRF